MKKFDYSFMQLLKILQKFAKVHEVVKSQAYLYRLRVSEPTDPNSIWHLGISNLSVMRSFRKWLKQESHSDFLPILPFCLETGQTPSGERCSLNTQRKERSCDKRSQEGFKQALLSFPPVYCTYLILLNLSYFYTTAHSLSNPAQSLTCLTVS